MFGITNFFNKLFWGISIFNVIVSIILISVGTHCKNAMEFGSIPIIGGIIACGVFLFLITCFGCFAAYGKNQTYLFYFIIGIGVVFLLQFSISIACLSGGDDKVEKVLIKQWKKYDTTKKDRNLKLREAETYFGCCGLDESDLRRNMSDNVDDYWKKERNHCIDYVPGCNVASTSAPTTTKQTTNPVPTTAAPTTAKQTTTTSKNTTPKTTTSMSTSTKIIASTSNSSTTQTSTSSPSTTGTTASPKVPMSTSSPNATGAPTSIPKPTGAELKKRIISETKETYPNLGCPACHDKMFEKIDRSFNTCGGLGIFFSLFQAITIFVTFKLRVEISKLGF